MPVTPNVKPQYAHQITAGFFKNFFENKLQTSVEVYYKKMENQIEFREFSEPYFNPYIEADFRFGEGRAYGAEFLVKKTEGKLSGWVAYTLSKSERKIKDIQEKDWFPSPYDHRHNISIVGMYDITKRISISANWVYLSGKPFDAPVARWEYDNLILPEFKGKNGFRYPDYHRLDFGLEIKGKPRPRFNSSVTLSVYNVYNKKNANLIYFDVEENNETKAYKFSLLPRIFSIAYNFNF
jgi:outer membrane receptor protein involved in Fe transport